MISERNFILYEGYIREIEGESSRGVMILHDGKRMEVPVEQLRFFSLEDFSQN